MNHDKGINNRAYIILLYMTKQEVPLHHQMNFLYSFIGTVHKLPTYFIKWIFYPSQPVMWSSPLTVFRHVLV